MTKVLIWESFFGESCIRGMGCSWISSRSSLSPKGIDNLIVTGLWFTGSQWGKNSKSLLGIKLWLHLSIGHVKLFLSISTPYLARSIFGCKLRLFTFLILLLLLLVFWLMPFRRLERFHLYKWSWEPSMLNATLLKKVHCMRVKPLGVTHPVIS